MIETKEAMLVILRSLNGRDHWELVKPEDVPEWVKDPDNMAHLVRGDACMLDGDDQVDDHWYCARSPEQAVRIIAAQNSTG